MDINRDMILTERCASAFGRMFWAFLFFLDFRIYINRIGVDLLPDFIGWLLIASALAEIIPLSPKVATLRTLAWWLVFLSLFDLVKMKAPVRQGVAFTTRISPMFPIGIVAGILGLILIWKLCGLIMDMADAVGDSTIWERAESRRNLYVAFVVFLTIAISISFLAPPFMIVAVIVGLPLAIVVFCLLMGLMKGTENMCRGGRI